METTFKGKETRLGRKFLSRFMGVCGSGNIEAVRLHIVICYGPLMNCKENGAKINRARGGAPLIYFMNIEPPLSCRNVLSSDFFACFSAALIKFPE